MHAGSSQSDSDEIHFIMKVALGLPPACHHQQRQLCTFYFAVSAIRSLGKTAALCRQSSNARQTSNYDAWQTVRTTHGRVLRTDSIPPAVLASVHPLVSIARRTKCNRSTNGMTKGRPFECACSPFQNKGEHRQWCCGKFSLSRLETRMSHAGLKR